MAYDVHAGMTDDPHGDIHKAAAGDRAKLDAAVVLMAKTATEFQTELYTLFMAAYFTRDRVFLVQMADLLMEFNGWKNGGGQTAVDAEAGP